MYYLFIIVDQCSKGVYFPAHENWTGGVHLRSSETGLSSDLYLPVSVIDGRWSISVPEGYRIEGSEQRTVDMEDGGVCKMVRHHHQMMIRFVKCSRETTTLKKFVRPASNKLTIGRGEDNLLQYTSSIVSHTHGSIIWNGANANYIDNSTNGSFVNGRKVHAGTPAPLKFGDYVDIAPALRIINLGDFFAVNAPSDLTISQTLAPFNVAKAKKPTAVVESIFTEYQRAPRQIQQPNITTVDLEAPMSKDKDNEVPAVLAIGPSVTMMLPMVVSAVAMGRSNIFASLAMVGTSSALAVTWSILNRKHQREEKQKNERNRVEMCTQYYAEMEELLSAETDRERNRLLYNFLSVNECIALPSGANQRLWERMPSHDDFLNIRLGLGETPLPTQIVIPKPKMSLINDPLKDEPQRLYDRYSTIHNVPVLLNTKEHTVIGILGAKESPWLMQSMVVQLCANHSYRDLRIAVIYNENTEDSWNWAKWLPHVYASDDHTLRMVVSKPEAIQEVLSHIDGVLTMRADIKKDKKDEDEKEDTNESPYLPYYVIFCTDIGLIEDHPIMRHLMNSNLGCTMILQSTSMGKLPDRCRLTIEARNRLGALYGDNGSMTGVEFEMTDANHLKRFSEAISSIRVKDSVDNNSIPTYVTFLDVYKARRVEDLDIWRFWNENHAYQGIHSYIGLKAGSVPFVLDISDKSHGPHGLIAGTTGAGKSVLLQSYILSLSINYSPTEVQFILIDYKGGGTSEDFKELPHVAGVIDSLQGERAIFRALASIKGEILRREEIFKSVGVNNIDDYMQLFNNDPSEEPLGHLIIIVDEFAELKKEQPDFMHELVSAARVGRSLGMHLILATQKPSNSVSDEIAANTRFRVCLRVASKSDSSEMLRRPEAAYLKGMGRCYVQVGNDEIFEQVQTSYSGAAYQPDELRNDEEPRMLNDAGQPIKFKKKKNNASNNGKKEREVSELKATLAYISKICVEHHARVAKKMWLDEIAHILLFSDIPEIAENAFANGAWKPQSNEELKAYFAMADDVAMQRHLPMYIDFIKDKNQMIVGLSGKGKTTAMQTMATSLALRYTPDQVQMYFFSLTSRALSSLSALPHVGDIVYEDEIEEQVRLLELLSAESERRKKLFIKMSTDSYLQYNRAARQSNGEYETVPAIVVFVDRMAQLRELENNKKEDKLQLFYDLLRAGASQGIYFVMSAFSRTELPAKYHPFIHAFALSLNDRTDYMDALNARIPSTWSGISDNPGRGVVAIQDQNENEVHIMEIQVALYQTAESDAERSKAILALGKEMRASWKGRLPRGIDRIPENPTLSDLNAHPDCAKELTGKKLLPIAYSRNHGTPVMLPVKSYFNMLIVGPRKSGKTTVLKNIALNFAMKNAQIHMVGDGEFLSWGRKNGFTAYEANSAEWNEFLRKLFKEIVPERSKAIGSMRGGDPAVLEEYKDNLEPIVILMDDVDLNMEKDINTEKGMMMFCHCVDDKVANYAIYVYASISHIAYARNRMKEPVQAMARAKRGILLGGRLSECDPFDTNVPYALKGVALPAGDGYLVSDFGVERIVVPKTE